MLRLTFVHSGQTKIMPIGIGEIVFASFVVVTLIQLFYYLGIFSRFAFRKEKSFENTPKQEPV